MHLLLFSIQFKGDLVTSSPDIYQVELGSDVEFILLASDGLWDYMKRFVLLHILKISYVHIILSLPPFCLAKLL